MRKIIIGSVSALALLATGCAARSTESAGPGTAVVQPAAAGTAAATTGGLGSTITVQSSGTSLGVTLMAETDPVSARPAINPGGGRLVGLEFQFANNGPAAWSDPGLLGLSAYDAAGNRLPVYVDRGVSADPLNGGLEGMALPYIQLRKIGWAVAVVPAGHAVVRVTYTAPGAATAVWAP